MSRQAIRQHKHQVRAGHASSAGSAGFALAQESALALLSRSISFGHPRLALVRLSMAVQTGAIVPEDQWTYCAMAAARSADPTLQALWQRASERAAPGRTSGPPPSTLNNNKGATKQ